MEGYPFTLMCVCIVAQNQLNVARRVVKTTNASIHAYILDD